MGSAGTIGGTVTDPSGGVVVSATVELSNPVTAYRKSTTTDVSGTFRFTGVPPNPYHLRVHSPGFQTSEQDVTVRTAIPIDLQISLKLASEATAITVHSESYSMVENVPSPHTDLDQQLFAKLPISSTASGLSDVITLGAPGVVADSNGFFHPLGEHADTSFSVDNQPISDQQSKGYANQMPLDIFQSIEVISGALPAEYGDKTSLVVNSVTRSGMGLAKPTGKFSAQYGSFGTVGQNLSFGIGGPQWGEFLAANSSRSGRFLDSPEFTPMHDAGNSAKIFNHFDYQPGTYDTLHLNLFLARSWLQVPNTYDQQFAGQDQRLQVHSFNVAPGWLHLFSSTTTLSINPFFRQDHVQYFPSRLAFSDQPATVMQNRRLSNAGLKADLAYVHGIHNVKFGVQVEHTFLNENFALGVTDPEFNSGADFQPGLAPYDLTRGGSLFRFRGHTDVKQEALYAQDNLTLGALTASLGLRGDRYDGLSHGQAVQPRVGLSYLIRPTGTVLRVAYDRLFETPYNENLVLSSATGGGGLAQNVFGAFGAAALRPGRRNQFNAGFQQAFGKIFVIDGDYFWKFTRNAFDFDTLFSTPITFPIEWRKSKVDGLALRLNMTNYHGLSAFTVIGHTRARLFGPEVGGLIFNSPPNAGAFRIDHDQAFEQTTHVRYQYKKDGPWIAFTWRYDSGMVAGSVPDFNAALRLTADEQAQMGLFCGGDFATVFHPISSCAPNLVGANRIRIPAAGTENDDTNPPRIAPRHLLDLSVGTDNLFHTDHPRWTLRLAAINLTNQEALYNFLSTFSGTHFVGPRSYQAELGIVF